MNKNAPLAKNDKLILPDQEISIGSTSWIKWLKANDVFHYTPPQIQGYTFVRHDITVKKRSNGYWYGLRTFNNKQNVKYIGKSEILDYVKLQLIVDSLSQL